MLISLVKVLKIGHGQILLYKACYEMLSHNMKMASKTDFLMNVYCYYKEDPHVRITQDSGKTYFIFTMFQER